MNNPRLLRVLAVVALVVVAFVVGLLFVLIDGGATEHATIVYSALLGGLALFALSFATT